MTNLHHSILPYVLIFFLLKLRQRITDCPGAVTSLEIWKMQIKTTMEIT